MALVHSLYRGLVSAVSFLTVYAMYHALRGESSPTVRALMVAVGALAVTLALAVWSRRRTAVYVQLAIIPLLIVLYLFEWSRVDPLEQMLHIEQWAQIFKTRLAGKQAVVPQTPLQGFADPGRPLALEGGERVIPLSGVDNMPTIMCREGARPFAEYVSDEYGFNNPAGLWGKPVDLVFVGDSMTYGACLPNRDHFIAQIRERYPATLNLGQGGIGPLFHLAMIREFVSRMRPRYMFYVYDENNDLYIVEGPGESDLVREYRTPILRRYLDDDGFSQRVVDRHAQIDAALRKHLGQGMASMLERRRPWKVFLRFLSLPLTRDGFRWIDPRSSRAAPWAASEREVPIPSGSDDIALFKRVFAKMLQATTAAGARFVFVNIPAQSSLCRGTDHPWKKEVLSFVAQTGVDLIDLEKDYQRALRTIGRDAVFAVPPCGGHFSEEGYKVIGDRLLQYLTIRDGREAGVAPEGWSLGNGAAPPRRRAVTAVRELARWTQVYEPYANVKAPLPVGPQPADRTHGASILGYAYAPRHGGTMLRVTVEFTAYSPRDNEVVAALFIGGAPQTPHVAVRPVKAGATASLTLTHTVELQSAAVPIEVRVGPRRPGVIYINGVDRGPAPAARTALTLEELKHEHAVNPEDQLIYRGTDVGEGDVAPIRQVAVQRRRASTPREPGLLGRGYFKARQWVNRRVAIRVSRFAQTYESHVRVDRVFGGDDEIAVYLEGASIMGNSFTPRAKGNLIRVRAVIPAWTNQANRIVTALFVNDASATSEIRSQVLQPGQMSAVILEFETTAPSVQPISFSIRIGPGLPGSIYLNGDDKGPSRAVPKPTFTIEEYWTFWP